MPTKNIPASGSVLATLAAFVIVVGGMKIAAPLLVSLLLALFIAILIASPYSWLQGKGMPRWLALLSVLLIFCGVVFLVGSLIGSSAQEFSARFPTYQERLRDMTAGLLDWLARWGMNASGSMLVEYLDPGAVMGLAAAIFSGMQKLLANSFLIMLTVIFILLEAPNIPDKWRAARTDADQSLDRFRNAMRNVNRYMAIKAATSLLTGVSISLALWLIGVDYPLLWGVMAFLLNFIPNIGSVIAAIPVMLLALLQAGIPALLLTSLAYLLVNIIVGSILEPRLMGKGLGLSTLVVFISLVLWGWVLGAVGMLLSVPLTIAMKIALDSNANTRWMAIMLGPRIEIETEPAETQDSSTRAAKTKTAKKTN